MSTIDVTIFLKELIIEERNVAMAEAEVKRLQMLRERLRNRLAAHEQYLEVLKANPIDDDTFDSDGGLLIQDGL